MDTDKVKDNENNSDNDDLHRIPHDYPQHRHRLAQGRRHSSDSESSCDENPSYSDPDLVHELERYVSEQKNNKAGGVNFYISSSENISSDYELDDTPDVTNRQLDPTAKRTQSITIRRRHTFDTKPRKIDENLNQLNDSRAECQQKSVSCVEIPISGTKNTESELNCVESMEGKDPSYIVELHNVENVSEVNATNDKHPRCITL